ncbi:MAG: FAD-dependent oxidoreductase [Myxococcota bacterium]|nr:FAD-dependent oxidoreductase [Myxococcota bacterium]
MPANSATKLTTAGLLALVVVACQPTPGQEPTDDTASGTGLPEDDPAHEVDVVIVGGGPAGLGAAWAALQEGASVLLVERNDQLGGTIPWAAGYFLFSGTAEQEALGIEDSPDTLLAEWPEFTGGDPEDEWVLYFAENNVPLVRDWIVDEMGVPLHEDILQEPAGGATARVHRIENDTSDLIDAISDTLPEDAWVTGVEVTDLVYAEDERVHGVWIRDVETDEEGWVSATTTVVATGGFLRNLDLVGETMPDIDAGQVWMGAGPGTDGNGHLMLLEHEATWDNAGAVGVYAHGIPDPRYEREELLFRNLDPTIWVNSAGHRFANEGESNSFETGYELLAQEGQLAWALFDENNTENVDIIDNLVQPDETEWVGTIQDLVDEGVIVTGDTVEAVAEQVGLNTETVLEEVEAFNATSTAGEVDPFRDMVYTGGTIDTAPFFAVRVVPTLAKAFGGIDVDLSGRVLTGEGDVLPGVYAAGELTGMAGGSLVGTYGFTGSLSAVFLSGRTAGSEAAREALGL